MTNSSVSVDEIIKLCLPFKSNLLGGQGGLQRQVTWACTAKTRPPAFDSLEGGEFALVALDSIRLIDPRVTLSVILEKLASAGVVGVATVGQVEPAAINLANQLQIPLVSLPSDVSLHELERSIIQLLIDRQSRLEQRGQQLYQDLAKLSIENRGSGAIGEELARLSGRTALLLDTDFAVQHLFRMGDAEWTFDELATALGDAVRIREAGNTDTPSPALISAALIQNGLSVVAAPVIIRDIVGAYIVLVITEGEPSDFDRIAVSRAALVYATEMAKERAVVEAQNRLQGDFLKDLFQRNFTSTEQMIARARYLGYDLNRPWGVFVFQIEGVNNEETDRFTGALLDEMNLRRAEATAILEGNVVAILWPLDDTTKLSLLKMQAEQLRLAAINRWIGESATLAHSTNTGRRGGNALPDTTQGSVSAGVGRYYPGGEGISQMYTEARQALTIAARNLGGNRTAYFGDLGIYRLLLGLTGRPELTDFYNETIARLDEYDRRNNGELLRTLQAFFQHHGNLSETAKSLYLHRNTLMYRMERIKEITGRDIDDPETRLSLQLALRVRELLDHHK